jgi:hypothetical protein
VLVAPPGEDRWFAILDGGPAAGYTTEELLDDFPPDGLDVECGVAERVVEAFGKPWETIGPSTAWAMLMLLDSMPPDFGVEFMRWTPAEIRVLREEHVVGGATSFTQAIRCLHKYRFTSQLDIRPPLRGAP